ncbi:hypothetical protein [Streptomyces sp. NPDC048696]|uniref:hypothetical protein n=1 Tax=unclassified Streptomyces TaxID=2593676 RepID=UPI0037145009
MEPVTGSVLAALLALKFSESLGNRLGEASGAMLGRLASFVKERLHAHDRARRAVERLEAAPEGETERQDAARELQQVLAQEPDLRAKVAEFLAETQDEPEMRRFLVQVSGQAKVGKIVQLGDVQGDISF